MILGKQFVWSRNDHATFHLDAWTYLSSFVVWSFSLTRDGVENAQKYMKTEPKHGCGGCSMKTLWTWLYITSWKTGWLIIHLDINSVKDNEKKIRVLRTISFVSACKVLLISSWRPFQFSTLFCVKAVVVVPCNQ